jgi:hypothetical protein
VLRAAACRYQLKVALAGGVDEYAIVGLADAQSLDVIDTAAELELKVLQDAPCSANGSVHAGAAETVEGLHFEMLREAVPGLIEKEEVTFDGLGAGGMAEGVDDIALILAEEEFAGLETLKLVGEFRGVSEFGDFKLTGGVINVSEAEFFAFAKNGGEVVRPVRVEQREVVDGARTEDLGDGTLDNFSRCGIAGLLGDGDALAAFDEFRDITLR